MVGKTVIYFFNEEGVIEIKEHNDNHIVCAGISATVQYIVYLDMITKASIIGEGLALLDFKHKKHFSLSKRFFKDLAESYPDTIIIREMD